MQYQPAKRIVLKSSAEFNEKWLQQQILNDPSILGLTDGNETLEVKDAERRQPHAGRLDVLLQDEDRTTRYEVEIQLGETDESHIIRTLEYWDWERRRFPQYEHIAVIVAEKVSGRFLNVINLFNQAVPLIAVEMKAIKVGEIITLVSTKILDLNLPAKEEEDDTAQETDRAYWEQKSTKELLQLTDWTMGLVQSLDPALSLKYNKFYIGQQRNGLADNLLTFRPRKKYVMVEFRLPWSEELDAEIEASELELRDYDKKWGRYRVNIDATTARNEKDLLVSLIRRTMGLTPNPISEPETL